MPLCFICQFVCIISKKSKGVSGFYAFITGLHIVFGIPAGKFVDLELWGKRWDILTENLNLRGPSIYRFNFKVTLAPDFLLLQGTPLYMIFPLVLIKIHVPSITFQASEV